MYFSTLELGDPVDARSWQRGCRSLGMKDGSTIFGPTPGMQRLASFFHAEPDWIYFSGHLGSGKLWADDGDEIVFQRDRVTINGGDGSAVLVKGEDFHMHRNASLLILGACSGCKYPARLRALRELFDNPTILGYTGMTRSRISGAMLGGGAIREHFFENLRRNAVRPYVSQDFVDAWLGAALAGFAGGPLEGLCAAVDSPGNVWALQGGKVDKLMTV